MARRPFKQTILAPQGQQRSGTGSTPNQSAYSWLRDLVPRQFGGWLACTPLVALIVIGWGLAAKAQGSAPEPSAQFLLNNLWIFIAAILVIFMNAGFAMLESGFCRQKNAVNILAKNLIVFTLASTAYWVIGYSLMYGNGAEGGFFYFKGLFFDPTVTAETIQEDGLVPSVDFLFQAAFAGTAATIVSGAVAERIKFVDFIIFSLILTGLIYPIAGSWQWNGGWLSSNIGFFDFAGSTVVHSVGGWAALTGAAILGPRIGKYTAEGQPTALPGHNLSIATLGCLVLWIGWFGFNPGSELAMSQNVPYIAVTTNLAAAGGGIAATLTSWMASGKPDLSMTINGILAGLVGITAGCAVVGVGGAFIIGVIAGIIVVFSVYTFDSIKIDDPVGAVSVHLVNGVWGTLAVGLFATPSLAEAAGIKSGLLLGGGLSQFGSQIVGVLAYGVWTVVLTTLTWFILKALFGLRVSSEEELLGLDIGEHGMEAYSGFLKDTSGLPSTD